MDSVQGAATAANSKSCVLINIYDSATFIPYLTRINTAVSFTNTIYHDLFSMTVEKSASIFPDSVTDLSDCQAEVDVPCMERFGCGGYTSHHRDVGFILDDLYSWYIMDELEDFSYDYTNVVLWTNYEGVYCEYACDYSSCTHTYPAYCAASRLGDRMILIMDLMASATSTATAHMSFLLAHELAHTLGYDDVYGTANHVNDSEYTCLMDYFDVIRMDESDVEELYQNWLEHPEDALCDTCKASIGNYAGPDE